MNETELEQLFRNAARDAPEASFDEQDVLRGSRRVTARRRTAFAGGSLVAAAVLVGGVGVGTGFFGQSGEPVAQAPAEPTQAPMALPQEPATPRSGPITLGDPKAGAECGAPDSALAAALAEQLPEAGSTRPTGADGSCPIGSRTAAVPVREGAVSGKVALLLSPSGAKPAAAEGRAPHTEVVEVPTRSGRTLTVLSEPMGAPTAPFADRLGGIAADLAPRF
ncbi:hypothetical protein [Saccharopolyspora sp. 7B]|uniref:hypothetical protein n=1 Tax=Saccharopolyspora sp. 7B TaxID=2877240 RepID=UPI001CD5AA31|nr:hypothetical protein [Saccharopolyspora sp. 7B]MCA1282839.1 hypothetical protein [Saccharopolyspora sp. 7B]